MSSLSAPASGAPCGTAIIRMADEKIVSSKEAPGMGGKEDKMELKASPHPPPMFTTQQQGTKKKTPKNRKDKDPYERSLSVPTLDNAWSLILVDAL